LVTGLDVFQIPAQQQAVDVRCYFSFAMPTIFLSTKLAAIVGNDRLLPVDKLQKADFINDWNAQLFIVDRRKCVIFTNKETLYSFVRLNIVKKDLVDLNAFFISSLFNQLKSDGLYNKKEEDFWLDNFKKLTFYRTDNDKKIIGSMNDFIYQLKVGIEHKVGLLRNPTDIGAGHYVNDIPMGLLKFRNPLDMFRDIKNNT
jgi:hypothetical protein